MDSRENRTFGEISIKDQYKHAASAVVPLLSLSRNLAKTIPLFWKQMFVIIGNMDSSLGYYSQWHKILQQWDTSPAVVGQLLLLLMNTFLNNRSRIEKVQNKKNGLFLTGFPTIYWLVWIIFWLLSIFFVSVFPRFFGAFPIIFLVKLYWYPIGQYQWIMGTNQTPMGYEEKIVRRPINRGKHCKHIYPACCGNTPGPNTSFFKWRGRNKALYSVDYSTSHVARAAQW